MHTLKKYIFPITLVIALSALYFAVRLYNLTSLPIFTDEAIYLRWAQTGLYDPAYRFLSLTDGKQPLFIWVMMPFIRLIDDPLVAGRIVSVLSGFVTMLGLGMVSYVLFKKLNVALLTMLLYLASPFAQVMDRMALYDSMVAMFFIWSLYLAIVFVRHVRLDIAYTLGFILGAGILTKTSNLLSIYLLPLTLFLFDWKQKLVKKRLGKWAGFALVSIIIAQLMYQVLRLSPLPNVISQKNNSFYHPFSEWIQQPFAYVVSNLNGMLPPLVEYLTLPYIILLVISLILIKKDFKEKIMLLLYFLLPFVGFAFIANQIFARYFFFMTLPLLLLAGWGLGYIIEVVKEKVGKASFTRNLATLLVIVAAVAYPLYVSVSFAHNPITGPIAQADKSQYVTAWTSGWGLSEVVDFFASEAQKSKIYVATEGTFGLYPQGIELYLTRNPEITIKGFYWEITPTFPQELSDQAKITPTYFVFYQPCPGGICPRPGDAPKGWPVTKVKEFVKNGTTTRVVIYQVNTAQ
ncbi:MAG: glycosyltransferase family 39 protein [Candidatus Levybacteria bacterium]|nr:glycosyltransferase family 39 protein [Candidatus Levybacteria bacterium]